MSRAGAAQLRRMPEPTGGAISHEMAKTWGTVVEDRRPSGSIRYRVDLGVVEVSGQNVPRLALLLLLLALAGCEKYETDSSFCAEECFSHAIANLSQVDHETPSGDAVHEIGAACWVSSKPCCVAAGVRVPCPTPTRPGGE